MTDDSWIARALSANPSTPADLLLTMANSQDRSITVALCHDRPQGLMPAEVAAVLAGSPHVPVRTGLVVRGDTSLQLIAELAHDPAARVRLFIAMRPYVVEGVAFDRYAIDETYELLARDPEPKIRSEVLINRDVPGSIKLANAAGSGHEDWILLRHGDEEQSLAAFLRLLSAADPADRKAAVTEGRHQVPAEFVAALLADPQTRFDAVRHCPLTPEQADELARDADPTIRARLAGNPSTSDDLVRELALDSDEGVRRAVLHRPFIPIDLLDSIAEPVAPEQRTNPVYWMLDGPADAATVAAYARSRSVIHRRTAANYRGLTAESVAELAEDEDFAVRLMLTERNPGRVPLSLLAEIFREWRGWTIHWMLRNPELPLAFLDQLVRSDDPQQRWYAAQSGRLTAEQRALLAEDPDPALAAYVDPARPARELEQLLASGDPDDLRKAARHPDVPVEVMWELWHRIAPAAQPG
ncbi:hypothetical protein QEZ54_18250 [Catellatospora sp. KI3]|uniref:hypothetical protein n=1 Tax=Catellatospora sp. KI3 TaxID=3041620 RepID=UPI002482D6F1|nr:hypothetical protein [Catellatospora sp. KI3]MDI1462922.1 hypothetical protein [Catellatospora sp. KI3]